MRFNIPQQHVSVGARHAAPHVRTLLKVESGFAVREQRKTKSKRKSV
jgi:hypothetical protein